MKSIFLLLLSLGVMVGLSHQACSSTFQTQFLNEHNTLRAAHGVGSLTLNATISAWAQDWADYLGNNDVFQHRANNPHGENLYGTTVSLSNLNGATPVQSWYNGESYYTYYGSEPPAFSIYWADFTQLIWKASAQVGVGCAAGSNGWKYIVANYNPRGNYAGQFAANVLAPI